MRYLAVDDDNSTVARGSPVQIAPVSGSCDGHTFFMTDGLRAQSPQEHSWVGNL